MVRPHPLLPTYESYKKDLGTVRDDWFLVGFLLIGVDIHSAEEEREEGFMVMDSGAMDAAGWLIVALVLSVIPWALYNKRHHHK